MLPQVIVWWKPLNASLFHLTDRNITVLLLTGNRYITIWWMYRTGRLRMCVFYLVRVHDAMHHMTAAWVRSWCRRGLIYLFLNLFGTWWQSITTTTHSLLSLCLSCTVVLDLFYRQCVYLSNYIYIYLFTSVSKSHGVKKERFFFFFNI